MSRVTQSNCLQRTHRTRCATAGLIVLACVTLACGSAFLQAHETDQYSVPSGRQFADLRFWFSEYIYDRLAAAVDATNARIWRTLHDGRPTSATVKAQSPDELAWAFLLEFPSAINFVETVEGQLRSPKLRSRYPGLVTCYRPPRGIYDHPLLLLDVTKFARLYRASTMMVNGSYFGTDKFVHFVHMGYLYFQAYRKSLAKGLSHDEAIRIAINEGAGSGLVSENNLLGYVPTGVISNGDKAANYVGLKLYMNLTEPVMLKGAMHPPLLVRDGEFYKLNTYVRRESDFLSIFVSDHWNESLIPNTYAFGIAPWVMDEVKSRCPDFLAWYRQETGKDQTLADFRRIAEELSTYYGEDYGFDGNLDEMVSIMTACFAGQSEPPEKASAPDHDSFGRTPLWRAARAGMLNEVESLVQIMPIDTPDIDGETPLHAAVRSGSAPVVRAMLRGGARVNAANRYGTTALHLAVQMDFQEAVESLLATGANVGAGDEFGCTPLHDAARRGSTSIVIKLLQSGADAKATDTFGTTPLHRAARAGRPDVMELLLWAGADSRAVNAFGKTPADEARAGRDQQAADILTRANSFSKQANAQATDGGMPDLSYPSQP